VNVCIWFTYILNMMILKQLQLCTIFRIISTTVWNLFVQDMKFYSFAHVIGTFSISAISTTKIMFLIRILLIDNTPFEWQHVFGRVAQFCSFLIKIILVFQGFSAKYKINSKMICIHNTKKFLFSKLCIYRRLWTHK
jgi:hypothetical protein